MLKSLWYWHRTGHADQWNQIEGPDINPHTYEGLIFDKEACNTQWGKKTASSTNGSVLTGCLHVRECKWIHTYHPEQNSSPNRSKALI